MGTKAVTGVLRQTSAGTAGPGPTAQGKGATELPASRTTRAAKGEERQRSAQGTREGLPSPRLQLRRRSLALPSKTAALGRGAR